MTIILICGLFYKAASTTDYIALIQDHWCHEEKLEGNNCMWRHYWHSSEGTKGNHEKLQHMYHSRFKTGTSQIQVYSITGTPANLCRWHCSNIIITQYSSDCVLSLSVTRLCQSNGTRIFILFLEVLKETQLMGSNFCDPKWRK